EKGENERKKALARELEWIRMSPKGRQAKHKEHIAKYEQLLAAENKTPVKDSVISIPAGPRLGNVVIEAQNLTKSFGDKLLFENVNFTVPPGAVVGIVGPNGAGKTTLFKMIVEAAGGSPSGSNSQNGEKPDSGTIRIGETVKIAYANQMRSGLDPNKTVWEQLSDGLDIIKLGAVDKDGRAVNGALREVNSRAYCSWFNFSGADQQKKVGVLSGGERNRLNLGMMIKTAANVLLLDEPTNDLDVATMRALEEAIERFAGCALIISHDRWFLDRICTHILAFENNSTVRWFEGTWSDYAEQRRKELGADADRPHKTIYRKMER
ncbi:MAG: ATP-binding cassette domain-containing protein, partial [Treponema maltophilum]